MFDETFRPRLIPVLLVQNHALVKSTQFKQHRYLGDPLNAARLFHEMGADELILLDISAGAENRSISSALVRAISQETNMPITVGGGIRSIATIRELIQAGAEKVVLGTIAQEDHSFVKLACETFGTSTIAVCIDTKQTIFGKQVMAVKNGTKYISGTIGESARRFEQLGVGELIVQSIDADGTMKGYDISTIQSVEKHVSIPIVALGGAGSLADIRALRKQSNCTAFAASSCFIFHGKNKGFLVHYPTLSERKELLLKPPLC